MATIGAEVQVTMHIGDQNANEYIRFRATIDNVDTTIPVEEQLNVAFEGLGKVFKVAEMMIDQKVKQHLGR